MSAPLADRVAPDVEEFVIAWLQPVVRAADSRRSCDPLPFCVVQKVAGGDDPDRGWADPVVQLDYFDQGDEIASAGATRVHRRMTYLSRTLTAVSMHDGSLVNPHYIDCPMTPERMSDAGARIARYTSRYLVGLPYVAV